jgi:hypothetical protein
MPLAATISSLKEDLTEAWLNLGGGGGWTLATVEVTGRDATDIVLAFPHVWLVVDMLCLPPLSLSMTSDGRVCRDP